MASDETLPSPKERWNQMCLTPREAAARATLAELSGCVTIMTP
jgi:hypothetical protein